AARSAACASVSVAEPCNGLAIGNMLRGGSESTTGALLPGSAGPWTCAAVAALVRLPKLTFQRTRWLALSYSKRAVPAALRLFVGGTSSRPLSTALNTAPGGAAGFGGAAEKRLQAERPSNAQTRLARARCSRVRGDISGPSMVRCGVFGMPSDPAGSPWHGSAI